jgi:hypothetical protein
MAFQVKDYPDPQGAAGDVIPLACVYIIRIIFNFVDNFGDVVAGIYRSKAAALSSVGTVGTISASLGNNFSTITELATNAAAYQAEHPEIDPFGAFQAVIYNELKKDNKFKGLTLIDID